jgi:hypothetical protein
LTYIGCKCNAPFGGNELSLCVSGGDKDDDGLMELSSYTVVAF